MTDTFNRERSKIEDRLRIPAMANSCSGDVEHLLNHSEAGL
ncbi:MAG: hypothetical protein ACLPX5_02175 [Dissulfurispiraceae bacterium]